MDFGTASSPPHYHWMTKEHILFPVSAWADARLWLIHSEELRSLVLKRFT